MDLDLSADQIALRDGIASLLDGRFGSDRVRRGFDRAMFEELREAGVFSLRADGFSWADCVIVFEQLGRFCVPGPLVVSLLSGADGVTAMADNCPQPETLWVEHLDVLDHVLLVDCHGAFLVDAAAIEAEPSTWPLDPLTPVSRVRSLTRGPMLPEWDEALFSRAGAVLTAAFLLGMTDRCTELAVAYAKERVQFDRPIGGFQAIKHLCADMLVRTEVTRAAVYAAGAHLDAGPELPGLDRAVSGAKALAGEAAIANGKAATQVFGGMGFTWEVDVHLYLKRAWVLDTHFGSADEHSDVVAAAVTPRT